MLTESKHVVLPYAPGFEPKPEDRPWRRAEVIWSQLAIGVSRGTSAEMIARIAAALADYKRLEDETKSALSGER